MDGVAWYKQFWPWLIISIPLSAVVFGMVMLVVASEHPDDLVADDYYRDGLAINHRLTRDRNARRLGIDGRLAQIEDGTIYFSFSNVKDSAVVLNLYHVVDRGKDRRAVLYPAGTDGVYSAHHVDVARSFDERGIWYLEFEGVDDNWRLQARVEMPVERLEIGSHE